MDYVSLYLLLYYCSAAMQLSPFLNLRLVTVTSTSWSHCPRGTNLCCWTRSLFQIVSGQNTPMIRRRQMFMKTWSFRVTMGVAPPLLLCARTCATYDEAVKVADMRKPPTINATYPLLYLEMVLSEPTLASRSHIMITVSPTQNLCWTACNGS